MSTAFERSVEQCIKTSQDHLIQVFAQAGLSPHDPKIKYEYLPTIYGEPRVILSLSCALMPTESTQKHTQTASNYKPKTT